MLASPHHSLCVCVSVSVSCQLPSSELFGAAEQTKRLKLLITLGHSALAAQGFATGRKDVIRKALRYVEASGDPAVSTVPLCWAIKHQVCSMQHAAPHI
jgi:hypothetical protein